jgi:hypothetical protein
MQKAPVAVHHRSANLIPGDATKNGLSRSEQKTVSTTQNNRLTGKAPYKFESISLQQRVSCELDFGRDAEGERYLSLLAVARAALHDRLGRRPCDVRTGQPVLRKFPRRPYRHEPVPLRAVRRTAPSTWHLQIVGKRDGLSDARRYPVTSAQVAKAWVRPDRSFAAVS